jgi:hypothetical protein
MTPDSLRPVIAPVVALLLAALAGGGCWGSQGAYLSRPEPIEVSGPYQHAPSGMTFPTSLGSFQRSGVMRFDRDGKDVSVGYNCKDERHPIVATSYVYPALEVQSFASPPEMVAQMRARLAVNAYEEPKRGVLAAHPGARLVAEGDAPAHFAGALQPGRMAVFELEEELEGVRVPVRSYLFVYLDVPRRDWVVKFRITHPRGMNGDEEIRAFIEHLGREAISTTGG